MSGSPHWIGELKTHAALGLPAAQYLLGMSYHRGNGVPKDMAEAGRWLKSAAENGHSKAQSVLGLMLWRGDGVPPDRHEALRWLRLSAEQGELEAQHTLGRMIERGAEADPNPVEALAWYTLASARLGDAAGDRTRLEGALDEESRLLAAARTAEIMDAIAARKRN
jgi:TPR repeat protein